MTDEHLRELKRQTRMMAERSAIVTIMICSFAFLMMSLLGSVYFPDYAPSSPWILLGVPVALALLCGWADYRQNTRG